MHKLRLLLIFIMFAGVLNTQAIAQTGRTITVSGTVLDKSGNALVGVTIIEKGTTNGIASDINGKYTITLPANTPLRVSYIGYVTIEVPVNNRNVINIVMDEDVSNIDEVVVVGYGTQKRATISGSVSQVSTQDLVATKNQNMQNALTGKLAGLRVVQKTAEPGNFNNDIQIRSLGNPLIIIDGVERDNMARLENNDIESVSILKDASASIYGVRASNGVILITTRKGVEGKMQLHFSSNFGWQKPAGLPALTNVHNFMDMRNERGMRNLNVNSQNREFSQDAYDDFLSGARHETDWWGAVMEDVAPQRSLNLSASGGGDKGTYFISASEQSQSGFLKNNVSNYKRYSLRSNVTANITKRLKVNLNILGTTETKNNGAKNFDWILRELWRQRPDETIYIDEEKYGTLYPRAGRPESNNAVAMVNKDLTGNKTDNNNWVQSSVGFSYDIPFIEGLQVKGTYSYDYYFSYNKRFEKRWNVYDANLKAIVHPDSPSNNTVRREFWERQNTLSNLMLNYNRTFGKHDVSGMVALEETTGKADNFYGTRFFSVPINQLYAGADAGQVGNSNKGDMRDNATRSVIGRAVYAYDSKYIAEFTGRLDQSSKFAPRQSGKFFPGASAAWRVSQENFWKDSKLSFIDNLKLRASFGKMGNDGANNFQFLEGYNYPGGGNTDRSNYPIGYLFGGASTTSLVPTAIPNYDLSFYKYNMYNLAVEADAWNGLLGFTFEVFQRDGSGLLATRLGSIPGIVGASLSQENIESDRTRGFDLELSHRNQIGDLRYSVKGTFSFARRFRLHQEKARAGNSWENWTGGNGNSSDYKTNRWDNIYRARESAGRVNSWDDIYNSNVYLGQGTIMGDYLYEDWNGDGRINDSDRHPIGYGGLPMYTFGLIVDLSWKGFDLNMLFQGAASNLVAYEEQLLNRNWSNGGMLEMFVDRWRPTDPTVDPYRTDIDWTQGKWGYNTEPERFSTFNVVNGSYLRLKSLEIGYTLPGRVTDYIGLKNVRVYANGYNLFTITKLKNLDPEHPEDSWGRTYPLNKVYSLGIDITF